MERIGNLPFLLLDHYGRIRIKREGKKRRAILAPWCHCPSLRRERESGCELEREGEEEESFASLNQVGPTTLKKYIILLKKYEFYILPSLKKFRPEIFKVQPQPKN